MTCIDPPPLTPDHLTAAIDGEAKPSIVEHLARCPHCAARLATAKALELQMRIKLDRWDCPTPQQLTDYHVDLLGEEQSAVEAHVAGCVACQAELAELSAFLARDEVPAARHPARPLRQARPSLRELVAQLLPRTPALALRGETQGPLVAQAGEVTLVLDVQPMGEAGFGLVGQLAAPDQEPWTGALAQLLRDGAATHTALVDDVGDFRFEGIMLGTIELRITAPTGPAILLSGLDIGGKASGS